MINSTKLPFTPSAFRRFAANAKAEGVSLPDYLARVSERGFGVPLAELVSSVFEDAIAGAASAR